MNSKSWSAVLIAFVLGGAAGYTISQVRGYYYLSMGEAYSFGRHLFEDVFVLKLLDENKVDVATKMLEVKISAQIESGTKLLDDPIPNNNARSSLANDVTFARDAMADRKKPLEELLKSNPSIQSGRAESARR